MKGEHKLSKKDLCSSIDKNDEMLMKMARDIWEKPELSLKENFASNLQAETLEKAGLRVTKGLKDMPTAIIAEYGKGKPIIGILGEYDALPDLSQDVVCEKKPIVPGGPGHGCGHNLLGTAGVGAAIALKEAYDRGEFKGTIRYYGCPAEETLNGKTFMARDGCFDDLDACISWHPSPLNSPNRFSALAVNSAIFKFKGITAHAGSSPHMGRSALDAMELMNVGANFLREHVNDKVRIHYSILDGGKAPNIVPDSASVWYMMRAPKRDMVDDTYERLKKIAYGAAMMTETTVEKIDLLSGCYDMLSNSVIADAIGANMVEIGGPKFTDEDRAFAKEMVATLAPGEKEKNMESVFAPKDLVNVDLHESAIANCNDSSFMMTASTDVGDVSYITPLCQFGTAVWPLGISPHTWRAVACTGSSIAMHGMIFASKVLAATAYDLLNDAEILKAAKDEFNLSLGGKKYVCPVGPDDKPR